MVLHPRRDSAEAVGAILDWAAGIGAQVLGVDEEISRLRCAALPVAAAELGVRSDLIVSLGGDGTMLRAMRLADGGSAPVLGVNLGKLGFLPEVDVPDLPAALRAIDQREYTTEPRLAVDAELCGRTVSAFNDVAVVRVPGHGGSAAVCLRVDGRPFVSYAADAVVVATPTGSTAYSFSAGGPIVSPSVEALLVTPAAPHSAFNRGLVLSVRDDLALEVLPASGRLAVEVDGRVCGYVEPGATISLRSRPGAAHVVRLGRMTFYERARRKLRLVGSAEVEPAPAGARGGQPTDSAGHTRSLGSSGHSSPPGMTRSGPAGV
ncbi:NAD(+)/NADH kinase [Pseudofrankia sp. DC12]|uniref:NAD(+)/NADH kinase n=1 Tax=Pseudofrankia sp. DC12 TaxID=683315 RepID=UPI0032D57AD1